MASMNISCHAVKRIAAKLSEHGGTRWLDLTIQTCDGGVTITLFPADHDDPRFAALAEFIAATWATGSDAVEAAPADDMPF
jgi:hypothetical protein